MSLRCAAALAVLLVGAGTSHGQELYRRTAVPGKDLCLVWNTREYVYRMHSAGSVPTPGETEFAAIEAAFQTWQTLSDTCSDFKFVRGPRIDTVLVGKTPGSEKDNVVTFREKACRDIVPPADPCITDGSCGNRHGCWDHSDATIALTTTTFSFKSGHILDADIELNAAPHLDGDAFLFTTVGAPPCQPGRISTGCVATDVQNTMTHEIGHVVGLDHVDNPGSTMEPSAPLGETKKRILDTGSGRGFCDTYPRGQPPTPCDEQGQLRRKVVAVNRGTPGLAPVGCSTTGGASGLVAVVGWALGRRRRTRVRPDPACAGTGDPAS